MKKISLLAVVAGLAMLAAAWALPTTVLAGTTEVTAHNKWPGTDRLADTRDDGDGDDNGDPTGVPEPGTLALLALGLGGVGAATLLRRRRVKA